MRAVGFHEFGGPEVLEIIELPDPRPGPGEVRIRVHAAAVNPTDTLLRSGARLRGLENRKPPYIPGMDAAGVIDEVGEGSGWTIGEHVMAIVQPLGPRGGAYAERIVVPADSVARTPVGFDDIAASTLPMNGLTARMTLDRLSLSPGSTLAVTGAAGAFGGYTVQLAKADGLRVIADAAPEDEELVRMLGADVVVSRGDVADNIRKAAPDGVDAVADGALIGEPMLAAIADGGALAAVRAYQGGTERGITVHQIWVREYTHEQAKLDRLRQQVEDGAVTLRVAGTYSPEQAAEAHRRLAAGGTRGRLVIIF